jgi:hypothetical protein
MEIALQSLQAQIRLAELELQILEKKLSEDTEQ